MKKETKLFILCVALTAVFTMLKTFGAISWTWIWVLSPLWIPIVITFFVAIVVIILALIRPCVNMVAYDEN